MKRHRNGGGGRSRPRAAQGHDDADGSIGHTDRERFLGVGDDFFRRSADRKSDQKARQLCRQVYRTLSVALPGLGDAALQDLTLIAVDPAPDAGHLLVTVSPGSPGDGSGDGSSRGDDPPFGRLDLLGRLSAAAGRLRAEVARDIVRKRAPELSFRIVPRSVFEPRGTLESHGEVTP